VMASLTLAFCLSFLLTWKMVPGQKLSSSDRQERSFVSAHAGEDLTLSCFYETQVPTSIYWYKQILGQRPKLISGSSKNDKNMFHGEIENSTHFKMDKRDGKALLTITDLHTSDSAIYHCIFYSYTSPIFSESVTVSVKGFGSNATLVNQPGSDSIQPGGFATLSCTVHPGSCDGEHSVYWYKKSEESLPVVFYTHGGMNDQCDSQSNACFYELPMENLTQTDAGMYYCAVASCGQVLFGNGTKLDFPDKVNPWVLVHLLSWALLFTMIFSIFLAFLLYNITKKNSCHSSGNLHSLWKITSNQSKYEPNSLHYAALSHKKTNRPRRHGNASNDECVYSNA
uniref:Ig-like domain-containing protein n=1 Tax=Salarias fasciatus TaxID=181472 RepID=A0A672GEQ8_SALFA